MTIPILDKIKNYIHNADVLIADCSGRNPNVFYELGMAHAAGKKVILITKDPVKEAPTDIRHMEFIHYELGNHVAFLERLDNALRRVFIDRYEDLYEAAKELFNQFRDQTKSTTEMAAKDLFIQRVSAACKTRTMPTSTDKWSVMEFALPKIVADNNDFIVISQLASWITSKLSQRDEPGS